MRIIRPLIGAIVETAADAFASSVGDKVGEAVGNWAAAKWLKLREQSWAPPPEELHETPRQAKRGRR